MTCNFEFLMPKAYPISYVVFCIYVNSLSCNQKALSEKEIFI